MKKLFSNPVFAVLLSAFIVFASSIISTRVKLAALSPEEILHYSGTFPGFFFIG